MQTRPALFVFSLTSQVQIFVTRHTTMWRTYHGLASVDEKSALLHRRFTTLRYRRASPTLQSGRAIPVIRAERFFPRVNTVCTTQTAFYMLHMSSYNV
ncbi:hypothetical protein [Paraburkholderia phenoliruptrix]|uniref:hypothetical protein n=1 Tax=Paraburkholderia phenoliruptrix TaxID=252970 RepID=UPI0028699EA6|nr:hypothetical protein [Paraburkholderia phenoliruptrix]WMY10298.1 hypothetical protein P3F88_26650 [Paraburkholderia phenoliruptrix]